MKKFILLGLSFFLMVKLSGQVQGINYQAVIVDQAPQEIPGRDITGNIMPNHPLMMRFSILDAAGTIEYQEEHSARTDMYGMINLVIGQGTPTVSSPGNFTDIDWNGTPKSLKVDLSLGDAETFYTDFSHSELTFVPYAFHRNITATGSLIVDGMTSLKSRVDVLEQSPTFLTGDLTVNEKTVLHNDLTVNSISNLNGQVTINPDLPAGDKADYASYPLRVEGGNQGIAIKIDGSRSSSNYFVTFWDEANIQGRIEGQTTADLENDPEYIFDNILMANEVIRATVDVARAAAGIVAASSSSTVCAGLGACVTAPVPSLIAAAIAEEVMEASNLALVVAEEVMYNVYRRDNIGVTYQSGAGDYAEWLPKADPAEKFSPGDIVGVRGGYISKNTADAGLLMVISRNPIVLGNMPGEGKESGFEKVAFLGQVPVKVIGKVNPGDLIIPAGNNSGTGVAVSPDKIKAEQYPMVVGIAWSGSDSDQYGYVNVAVGLTTAGVAQMGAKQEQKIKEQETEINSLRKQLDQMNDVLSQLVPNYTAMMEQNQQQVRTAAPDLPVQRVEQPEYNERTIFYQEISRDQFSMGLGLAEQILKEKGLDVNNHPFFMKMRTEPSFRENFINDAMASVKSEMEKLQQEDTRSGAKVVVVKQESKIR